MNFLAHIYLSSENDSVKIGNFIADSIRGKKYKKYPLEIQRGILLHRHIDSFTDSHSIVSQSKKRLFNKYRHYSSVIVDIYYDHFLAKNWKSYSETELSVFAKDFYTLLEQNFDILPERYQDLFPFMKSQNWLLSYASLDGIQRVFNGMNKRAKHKSRMNEALYELELYYSLFEEEFTEFFNKLMTYSDLKKAEVLKQLEL